MAHTVEIVPCLQDNYAYVVVCGDTRAAVVIDPSEHEPLLAALQRLEVTPVAVLATHHHPDHVGGVEGLVARFPGLRVVCHTHDKGRIPCVTETVDDGGAVTLGALTFTARHVPGHTLGAIAWHVEDAVFTGDTMFLGGCGRLFEGTPAMMHRSLCEVIAAADGATRVYCGHEYTVSNLLFAKHLEPDNREVLTALDRARALRAAGLPTVPGSLADERRTNPFLRCASAGVRKAVGVEGDDVAVLAAVRAAKDVFRAS